MWKDIETGNLYIGDCRVGDVEATADEIAAWQNANKPDVKAQILAETDKLMASGAFAPMAELLMQEALKSAQAVGDTLIPPVTVTPDMLYDPASPYYNPTFAKFKAFYDKVVLLRDQLP